jgi:hypothetical protein
MNHPPPEATSPQTYLDELECAIKRARDDAGPDVKAGLAASIAVCEDWKDRLLVTIREANRRYGIRHADLMLVCDAPPELQMLNRLYQQIGWRIDDVREVQSRVVVRPDGETVVLPPGHTFAGFSEDGKVISGHMTVVHDENYEAAEHARHMAQRAKVIEQYGSEEAYSEHCLAEAARTRDARREALRLECARRNRASEPLGTVAAPRSLRRLSRQRRDRERRPAGARRTASSSTASSADPPDADGDSEPPSRRGHLRRVGLIAFLRAIGDVR